jgi:hypothetical protein
MSQPQPQPTRVLGDKVWCPSCGEYVKVVRVSQAVKIVDVDRRTIYHYVKTKKVSASRSLKVQRFACVLAVCCDPPILRIPRNRIGHH